MCAADERIDLRFFFMNHGNESFLPLGYLLFSSSIIRPGRIPSSIMNYYLTFRKKNVALTGKFSDNDKKYIRADHMKAISSRCIGFHSTHMKGLFHAED